MRFGYSTERVGGIGNSDLDILGLLQGILITEN